MTRPVRAALREETEVTALGLANSPPVERWLRAAPAVLAVLAGLIFLGVQIGQPTVRGPDAAYYLLGAEHLAAGRWPWGAEPPLAFAVFLPIYLLIGGLRSFTVASALWGGLTVYSLGLLGGEAYRSLSGRGGRATALAAAWACGFGVGYMFFCFVSGLFKNAVANVFLILSLRELFRGRRAASAILVLLAGLSHPGAAATLPLAAVFAGSFAAIQQAVGWVAERRPSRAPPPAPAPSPGTGAGRRAAAARTLTLAVVAAAAALLLGRAVTPTFMRYFGTYLGGPGQVRLLPGDVFTWDSLSLFMRYLPLWPLAAGSIRLYSVVSDRRSRLAVLTAAAWVFVLTAMASLGGLTGRRFEIQLFIPLVTLAAVRLAGLAGPGHGGVPGPGGASLRVLAALALVFGLVLQGGTIATSGPALTADQVEALKELDSQLPADAVLCVYMTDVRYWAEYLVRRPVLAPDMLRGRMELQGPVFLLTQDPTPYETWWPPDTLARLRGGGTVVWERESFVVLRARRDAVFLAAWTTPAKNDEVIQLLDAEVPPAHELPGYRDPRPHKVDAAVGWLLFAPLGLARLAGLGPAPALAIGLPATAAWWLLIGRAVRRRLVGRGCAAG